MSITSDELPATPGGQEATARSYRAYAAAEREAAETEPLPNRRLMLMRSAEVWDHRAAIIEEMLDRRRTNEAPRPPSVTPSTERRRR